MDAHLQHCKTRSQCLRMRSSSFFQAEDGIRDYKVTGVQSCALPICLAARQWRSNVIPYFFQTGPARRRRGRSEERRVGKECRSRWSPDHLKKKNIQLRYLAPRRRIAVAFVRYLRQPTPRPQERWVGD